LGLTLTLNVTLALSLVLGLGLGLGLGLVWTGIISTTMLACELGIRKGKVGHNKAIP
jgi:hypothetical protein